jgi:hypothetical protein
MKLAQPGRQDARPADDMDFARDPNKHTAVLDNTAEIVVCFIYKLEMVPTT